MLHLAFEFGADVELVVEDHVLEVVHAAVEFVEPPRGAFQAVGGADVEHQEAVGVLDDLGFAQISGEQLRMLGFHPAVAADVEVVALVGGDDAEVLALRFGTFTRTAADRAFQLMR